LARRAVLTIFIGSVMALAMVPLSQPTITARQIRQQLLMELQPVALQNCTMKRVGSPNDGGYLMCGNLLGGVESAYSYGHWTARRLGM
jgi:hypothetical protein